MSKDKCTHSDGCGWNQMRRDAYKRGKAKGVAEERERLIKYFKEIGEWQVADSIRAMSP